MRSVAVRPERAQPRMAEGGSGDGGGGAAGGGGRAGPGGARGLLARRAPPAPISPGRLPSIRSRDLTLGGVKKKTFTPNIISRKIKEEPRDDVGVKKEKKERERERHRDGHGRGRGRPDLIQSHSIFEQGPAEMMKKKAGAWDRAVELSDFGPSHIINIKKEKRETDEETKQILRMLQKDDFLDDPGLKNDARHRPVQLPLAHSGWLFREEGAELEDPPPPPPPPRGPKHEDMDSDPPKVKVKEEPRDEEDPPIPRSPPPPRPSPPSPPPDSTAAELLQLLSAGGGEELLFLQLPDTLPGHAAPRGDDGGQDTQCTLADLPEGRLGKLVVRRSGRVQLLLGSVSMDVSAGTRCAFLQELVSVGVGDGRTGDMTVLGHVRHKLVCSPDFEALLEHRHR